MMNFVFGFLCGSAITYFVMSLGLKRMMTNGRLRGTFDGKPFPKGTPS